MLTQSLWAFVRFRRPLKSGSIRCSCLAILDSPGGLGREQHEWRFLRVTDFWAQEFLTFRQGLRAELRVGVASSTAHVLGSGRSAFFRSLPTAVNCDSLLGVQDATSITTTGRTNQRCVKQPRKSRSEQGG